MTITEKLIKLTENKNKAELARKVGLKSTIISDYIARGYTPRADIALKMARALEVPVEWLIDDNRDDLPPPDQERSSLQMAGDAELVGEVARRYRSAQIDFLNEAAKVKAIDWNKAADAIQSIKPGQTPPDSIVKAIRTLESVETKFNRISADFDVARYCAVHHDELPGADHPVGDFFNVESGEEWVAVENFPGIKCFAELMKDHQGLVSAQYKKVADAHSITLYKYVAAVASSSRKTPKK